MKLENILNELGIEVLPDQAVEIFNSEDFDAKSTKWIDKDYMLSVSRKYNYFGIYESQAIENAGKIKNDEALLAMLNLTVEYINSIDGCYEKVNEIPMPQKAKDKDALAIFSAVMLMTQIEPSEQRYLKMGFTPEEAFETVKAYGNCFIRGVEREGIIGMTELYRPWLYIYVAALIVKVDGYNFEVRRFSYKGAYLKNKNTGEIKALVYNEMVHRSGNILGSAGFEDEDGSFYGEFIETEDEYVGCVADENALIQKEKCTFKKSEWELVLKPGDDVIAFHIPKGADLSRENLDKVFKSGTRYIRERYPDRNIKFMTCGSWLLSPQLKGLLKPTSNILAFGDRYVRFPMKDSGMAVFSFVFIGKFDSYNDLPENTSLERALKKHYLDGEYIHSFAGAFEIE